MKRLALTFVIILLLTTVAFTQYPITNDQGFPIEVDDLSMEVNRAHYAHFQRVNNGKQVKFSRQLYAYSLLYARTIIENGGELSHDYYSVSMKRTFIEMFAEYYNEEDLSVYPTSENLAKIPIETVESQSRPARFIVEDWKNSPEHYEGIIDPQNDYISHAVIYHDGWAYIVNTNVTTDSYWK